MISRYTFLSRLLILNFDLICVISGSHDSMTYAITRSSGLAPDAESILKRLYPLFKGTILRWTITQSVDALQQLHMGIRYVFYIINTTIIVTIY